MDRRRKEPPEGYVSLTDIINKCKEKGLNVNISSLKYRFDAGEIPGIRDLTDPRKRRLVETSAIADIFLYYEKTTQINSKKRRLCDLAEDLGIKEGTLYVIAERKGIPTAQWGNNKVLTESEYSRWKDLLKEEIENNKKLKEGYITTGHLAKEFETSHHMIIYWIKQRKIPAEKINNQYLIHRKDFEEHGKEWKSTIESEKVERDKIRTNYISRKELSRRWNTPLGNIRYRIKTGKIPVINLDGEYFISRAEFEEHGEEWRKECGY